jgi:serine O-acetyltransferase
MNLFEHIREDTHCILERDPAATSRFMVLLCYPCLQAI